MKLLQLPGFFAVFFILSSFLFSQITKEDNKTDNTNIQIGDFAWRKGANDVAIFFNNKGDSCKVIQTQRFPINGYIFWMTIKDYSKIGRCLSDFFYLLQQTPILQNIYQRFPSYYTRLLWLLNLPLCQ